MRLLLVEDDALLGDGTRSGLSLSGYAVDWVKDGESALNAIHTHDYDACERTGSFIRCALPAFRVARRDPVCGRRARARVDGKDIPR